MDIRNFSFGQTDRLTDIVVHREVTLPKMWTFSINNFFPIFSPTIYTREKWYSIHFDGNIDIDIFNKYNLHKYTTTLSIPGFCVKQHNLLKSNGTMRWFITFKRSN